MSETAPLSAECRLVFRCADAAFGPAEASTLAGVVADWKRAVMIAEHEFAAASVWRALRHTDATIPSEVADHLRKLAMVSDLRMQHLSRRLQQTVRMLAERGVPVLLLKGAAVGAIFDPTFRLRPMSDIDLLVRPEDAGRARDAIIKAGWPQTTDPVVHQLLRDQHHLPPFLDTQMPGLRLELHTSLLPTDHPFTIPEADLWLDARPAPEPFAGALVPSLPHLLLHTCVHFSWQHMMQFGAWRTVRVVGLVSAAPDFDWERFVVLAREAKAATACFWTLRLAERLSGSRVPSDVLARLAPPTPAWLCVALERHFVAALAPGETPPSPSIRLTRLLWRAAIRPSWSGHRTSVRWDPEHRWERARGTLLTETFVQRAMRHAADYRNWWQFFSRTLLG